MKIHKIFGPPGSGKTTYLLNLVEQELESGVPSRSIGYFAFTRKAANEAKERAIAKFNELNAETDFPWFRTLHSLAYRCLRVSNNEIMKPEHYREFARSVGLDMSVSAGENSHSFPFLHTNFAANKHIFQRNCSAPSTGQ